MKLILSAIAVLLTICFLSGNVIADSVVLNGIEEAYVFDDEPGTTHNDTTLRFLEYSNGLSQWSFIKFDLSGLPENAEISQAKFQWYAWGGSGSPDFTGDYAVNFYHVADDTWDEGSITWNNMPGYDNLLGRMYCGTAGGWKTSYFVYDAASIDNWNESIDLTDNYLSIVGLINPSTAYSYSFLGGTSSTLTLEYTAGNPVPVPPTFLLLGSGLVGLAGFRKKFMKK